MMMINERTASTAEIFASKAPKSWFIFGRRSFSARIDADVWRVRASVPAMPAAVSLFDSVSHARPDALSGWVKVHAHLVFPFGFKIRKDKTRCHRDFSNELLP